MMMIKLDSVMMRECAGTPLLTSLVASLADAAFRQGRLEDAARLIDTAYQLADDACRLRQLCGSPVTAKSQKHPEAKLSHFVLTMSLEDHSALPA